MSCRNFLSLFGILREIDHGWPKLISRKFQVVENFKKLEFMKIPSRFAHHSNTPHLPGANSTSK